MHGPFGSAAREVRARCALGRLARRGATCGLSARGGRRGAQGGDGVGGDLVERVGGVGDHDDPVGLDRQRSARSRCGSSGRAVRGGPDAIVHDGHEVLRGRAVQTR